MARTFVTAEEVAKRAGVSRSAVSRTFTPGAKRLEDCPAQGPEGCPQLAIASIGSPGLEQ